MPNPDRPDLPAGYGIRPAGEGRLVAWAEVEGRLAAARNFWLVTASLRGRPHVAPVWGLWRQGAFYFGTDPASRKGRNLAANPSVVVHLESGDEVVIVEGRARRLDAEALEPGLDEAYHLKYGVPLAGNPVYRVEPTRAFAWTEADFPESATRWRFEQPGAEAPPAGSAR